MPKPLDENERFLKEYAELCTKHKLKIGSCGCCDSPFVTDVDADYPKDVVDHVQHLRNQLS